MSRRRRIKPAYVWGCMSNTEPPDDDDLDGEGSADDGADELTFDEGWNLPDDCAAEKAADRWEQDRDRRAGS